MSFDENLPEQISHVEIKKRPKKKIIERRKIKKKKMVKRPKIEEKSQELT